MTRAPDLQVIPYDLFLHSTPPGNDAKAGAS